MGRVGAVALLAVLLSSGCALKKGSAADPPIQQAGGSGPTKPAVEVAEGPLSTPQTQVSLPPPQSIPEGAAPPQQPVTAASGPVVEPPPAPAPSENIEIAQPAPRPAPPPAVEPESPAPPPQLGPILSASQRQAYNREIDQSILATRRLLDLVTSRSLSFDQAAEVRRIRAFLNQAAETREQDVAQSRNLAQRARVLADDLERSTR